MHEVPEGQPLAPPALCVVCEHAPLTEAGIRVVETGRNFDGFHQLAGTKYLCSTCITGALLALVPELAFESEAAV